LQPAGEAAERISVLFWQMTVAAAIIWLAVVAVSLFATFREPTPDSARQGRWLIIGGGVILPTIVLAVLLAYGLAMLPSLLSAAPPGSVQIHVTAEQYFWRVRYLDPDGRAVELANELHLPVGQHAQLHLESRDVIHSFWVPALAGKVDMIPGRTTQLRLSPTRTGSFHGVCAEYCGTSHAFMALRVVVSEPAAFSDWLAREAEPAHKPVSPSGAVRGAELFAQNGCGACHSVRGSSARGVIGPDLTHVGSRATLGAGMLDNDREHFARFLGELDRLKPETGMPHYGMLSKPELDALGAYLEALQ
jgi:cytochrome c oxidase subunit II